MIKVAIVILADTATPEDFGRVVNALEAVKEFKEARDEVRLIFDGAGTQWIGELARPGHKYKPLFDAVQDTVAGVCAYCANAYGVKASIEASGLPFAAQYEGHPSFRQLLVEGYQVLTF
jgi:hypothetical protein